jgi:GNAT superfamily N-acetyltransferase
VYAPDDPNILYTGRIDFSNAKEPKFSAPAVYIRARFRGTGVSVLLEDEFKWGTNRNYFDAVIDDNTVVKIAPEQGVTRYEAASGLPNAEHTITLVKRTEASIGYSKFLGFEFDGEILPPPEKPARRIEFIGDSITAGAGIEADNNSAECQADGWGQPYNNARLAYGPVLARSLGTEYHVSAVSGIGRRLMERIEAWLRDHGATRLTLTSGKQRTEAHRFYRRLGYEETGLRFVKRL